MVFKNTNATCKITQNERIRIQSVKTTTIEIIKNDFWTYPF